PWVRYCAGASRRSTSSPAPADIKQKAQRVPSLGQILRLCRVSNGNENQGLDNDISFLPRKDAGSRSVTAVCLFGHGFNTNNFPAAKLDRNRARAFARFHEISQGHKQLLGNV